MRRVERVGHHNTRSQPLVQPFDDLADHQPRGGGGDDRIRRRCPSNCNIELPFHRLILGNRLLHELHVGDGVLQRACFAQPGLRSGCSASRQEPKGLHLVNVPASTCRIRLKLRGVSRVHGDGHSLGRVESRPRGADHAGANARHAAVGAAQGRCSRRLVAARRGRDLFTSPPGGPELNSRSTCGCSCACHDNVPLGEPAHSALQQRQLKA
mmetsp:Transcript_36607/g.80196  ORF Transcript_36607/g.80196 Transcript_36607/m.80196 type:complete len:211 (-) Transcript_36607:12-644(-)